MPAVLASFALAGAVVATPQCQWTQPGANRFTGDLVKAVDHYADLPAPTRERLKAKLASHAYDDRIVITRYGMQGGQQTYEPRIQDMHFGRNRVCRDVKLDKWPSRRKVQALVYCDDGHCLMVPSVCGNLSRVTLAPQDGPLDIAPAAGPAGMAPPTRGMPAAAAPQGSLDGLSRSPAAAPTTAPPSTDSQPQATPTPVVTGHSDAPPSSDPPDRGEPSWPPGYPDRYVAPPYSVSVLAPPNPAGPVIPEPPPWRLWLLGIPLIALARWRSTRRS